MNGYRPMVMEILKRRFPETDFTFTDAGISSTCSTTGAFRLSDELKGASRSRFTEKSLLCAETPGSELVLEFDGKAVGAYVLAGPDAGIVETSVDDAPYKQTNLFHRFSTGLHYPRTVIFEAGLAPGPHLLKLRIADSKHPDSLGHAMRVLSFVAN